MLTSVSQTNADDGYLVIEGAQACGLNIEICISRLFQSGGRLSNTPVLTYDSIYRNVMQLRVVTLTAWYDFDVGAQKGLANN